MKDIKIYKKNEWVNNWVTDNEGVPFIWEISTQAPRDRFEFNVKTTKEIANSGLSTSAKSCFFTLLYNRFSNSRVCLYGVTGISKRMNCCDNTARKAITELIDCRVIERLKIVRNGNVSYQYYLNDRSEWELPSNERLYPKERDLVDTIE